MSASDNALPRVISVSGLGEVKTPPDMATITSGVVSEAVSAKDALAKNNAAMAAVIAALKNAGVNEDDIQTSDFSVNPKYPPYQPNQSAPQRVTAQIKNLKNLGSILDTLVQSGSNQINGISFGIDEPKKSLNEARKKAAADARAKAELYAEAAGVSLGRVVQITESSTVAPPMPMYRAALAAQAADAAVPIAAGQQTVSANVTIVYEIQ
jgi:hypothetical protein